MSARRPVILMGILLVLLAGYTLRGLVQRPTQAVHAERRTEPLPVRGKNTVSALQVKQAKSGLWTADFDYFYAGPPRSGALSLNLTPNTGSPLGPNGLEQYETQLPQPQPGAHHESVEIRYPGTEQRTYRVSVFMRPEMFSKVVLASGQVDQVIDWPDFQTWVRDEQMGHSSADDNFNRAVGLIDSEGEQQLAEAKTILESLIQDNPQFDPGYVELARIAMKSNWGPEGLHQAEGLLSSALQIHPDSVNAKILLGYVYAHQKRFAQADSLFTAVASAPTNNLWLWSNWGELLAMEGKPDQAIRRYQQAIAHPMTHDTYDRARVFAYEQVLQLLQDRKDLDGMEKLYKQRIAEFGPGSCYSADYTRFLLQVRGDAQGAIDLATRALNQNCDDSGSRQLLGMAQYVKWTTTTGSVRTESLNQAHLFLPPGAKALFLLSQSARTLPAARDLVAAGEAIDQKDNEGLTALAHALQNRDPEAAQRLIALGARPDTPVGVAKIPVALLPVIGGDAIGVRIMRRLGVNYSQLKYRGATAFDFARQAGNTAVLDALGNKEADL
jgi:tetratricopeptide (TPR) repeat protein